MAVRAVALDQVTFSYPDGTAVLRGITCRIAPGEIVGILGANGAGKSTLLLHLNGLLRGSGSITVSGITLADHTLPQIRARVGFVFQNPDDQLFMPTVRDDVAFGPRNQGHTATEVERRVVRALEIVGMEQSGSRPPHHLSIGQKKRVALATVLAMDCEVLVLDEPTSGLDPRGRRELSAFIGELPQTRIIATHDLEFAVELCDRVLVLEDGAVVAEGSPRHILADGELMERTGLEVPHSLRFHAHGIAHEHGPTPAQELVS